MNVDAEPLAKFSRCRRLQRRARGDERAHGCELAVVFRQRGEMFEHHRNQRHDRAAMTIRETDDRERQVIIRQHDRRSLQDERRDEIREAVRMRERDRAEVRVVRRDVHR